MSIDTYRFASVARAPSAAQAVPTLPAFGALMDWSDKAPWVVCPFEFAEDDFSFTNVDENALIVKPPARQVKTEKIRNAVGIESIEITAYEVGAKVYGWATNGNEVGGVFSFSNIHTRVSLAIEVGKIGLLYFPSVEISFDPPVGGIWKLATQRGMIDVFGTDAIPAGFEWHQYQP